MELIVADQANHKPRPADPDPRFTGLLEAAHALQPRTVALLLSDAAAALDYDIAADALELLRVDPPEDDDEVWPEGSLDILADIGLPAPELQVIIDEVDLYPDEQLQMVAQRCGFDEEFSKVLDTIFQ